MMMCNCVFPDLSQCVNRNRGERMIYLLDLQYQAVAWTLDEGDCGGVAIKS
jgi:hypothetical protein